MKLIATGLATAPEGNHKDHVVSGLVLRVGKIRKAWVLRHYTAGQNRKSLLGYYPGMGLAEAREAARGALGRIELGAPLAEEKPKMAKEAGLTIEQLLNQYESAKIKKGGKGVKSLPESMRAVRKGLAKHMKVSAAEFSKADMRSIRDKIAKDAPQMSDRFLAYAGPIWRWAAQEDKVPSNFIPDLLRVGPGLVRRSHILDDDELVAIWNACADLETASGKSFGRLVRFLMVTAVRRNEGSLLRHGRIIGGHWKLTKEETKAARDHLVKLPSLALDQIDQGEAGKLIFPGRDGAPLGGWSKLKQAIDTASGVEGWRLHDLRRTVASRMQRMQIPRETIEGILSHSIPGVAGSYLHDTLEAAKAEAWQAWNVELAKIIAAGNKKSGKL